MVENKERKSRRALFISMSAGCGVLSVYSIWRYVQAWPVYVEGSSDMVFLLLLLAIAFFLPVLPPLERKFDASIQRNPGAFRVPLYSAYPLFVLLWLILSGMLLIYGESVLTYWLGRVMMVTLMGSVPVLILYIRWHRAVIKLVMDVE